MLKISATASFMFNAVHHAAVSAGPVIRGDTSDPSDSLGIKVEKSEKNAESEESKQETTKSSKSSGTGSLQTSSSTGPPASKRARSVMLCLLSLPPFFFLRPLLLPPSLKGGKKS